MTPYLTNLHIRNEFVVEPEPSEAEIDIAFELAEIARRTAAGLIGRNYAADYFEVICIRDLLARLALKQTYRNRLRWGSDE